MAEQSQQLLSSMSQEDWSEIYTRLLFYAYKRYHHLVGVHDLDLQDIVQQAIADTLQGTRHWSPRDSEKGEVNLKSNLFIFLCGVVDSNIY
jgi:DNA-directed RNA polymerase specialized sigma24 family protein